MIGIDVGAILNGSIASIKYGTSTVWFATGEKTRIQTRILGNFQKAGETTRAAVER